MHKQLQAFDGQRFDGVMDLMRTVQQAGFADEFDISLIMRTMWNKLHELQAAIGQTDSKVYLTTKAEQHPLLGTTLRITMHSSIVESASVFLDLFIRSARLAVSSDVLTEKVEPKTDQAEVLASGVYWFEAEKSFKACPRFDKVALKAFKALYKALAPRGDDVALRLQITPLQMGWRVEYRMHGTKILVTQFEFNKQ